MSTNDFTDLGNHGNHGMEQNPPNSSTSAESSESSKKSKTSTEKLIEMIKLSESNNNLNSGLASILLSALPDSQPVKEISAAEARELAIKKEYERAMRRVVPNAIKMCSYVDVHTSIAGVIAGKLRAGNYTTMIEDIKDDPLLKRVHYSWA